MINHLYEELRTPFIQWLCQHFNALEHEAIDIFQDVIIIFYKNITSGKIDSLNSSIKTYLFAIGKHIWLKRFRKKQNTSSIEDLPNVRYEGWDLSLIKDIETEDQRIRLQEALQQLGNDCRKLLVLAFFHNYSSEALQHEFGFKTADVVRTKKYRCMNQLKKLMKRN